jgi:hypothetical protein
LVSVPRFSSARLSRNVYLSPKSLVIKILPFVSLQCTDRSEAVAAFQYLTRLAVRSRLKVNSEPVRTVCLRTEQIQVAGLGTNGGKYL